MGLPDTAHGLFLAHAFLWGAPPDRLARYTDMPWVRADLFHVEKLAHAVEAQGRRRWVRAGEQVGPSAGPGGVAPPCALFAVFAQSAACR